MKWRDQLALLLGAASPLGLAANGSLAAEPAPTDEGLRADPPDVQKDLLVFRDPAERERLLLFAGHRSHSSHSSHRSHYSGSSGGHSSHSSHHSSSGGYVSPAPVYTAPPAPRPRPIVRPPAPRPTPAPLKAWEDPGVPDLTEQEASDAATDNATPRQRLTTGEVASMVTKVQVALVVRGYDPGPVDGRFGAKTKVALGRFQSANNLPITASMDLDTLRLLGVEVAMPSRKEPVAALSTRAITSCGIGKFSASPNTAVFASRRTRASRPGEIPDARSVASGMPAMPRRFANSPMKGARTSVLPASSPR